MRTFDHDYANEVVARLNRIKPDAKPLWGAMTPAQLFGHLAFWVKYSMGKGQELPFVGNWFTTRILGPITINGWARIPRNIRLETRVPVPESTPMDTETLHAVLETYLGLVQSGELTPHRHPLFGDIGVDGWAKMHMVHFEHHLRQFGV